MPRCVLWSVLAALVVTATAGTVWRSFTPRPRTPLALAAHNGDVAAIRALIAAGADPNAADARGYTPLAWAAPGGQPLRPHACREQDPQHLEAVRLILELGADPNHADANGWLADRVARHHRQDAAADLIARAQRR